MDLNYREIAENVVALARENNVVLDYTKKSIDVLDEILEVYHRNRDDYEGEEGEERLWNIACGFGIYLGETLLRVHLAEKGFGWAVKDGMPVLKKDDTELYPASKAYKRITNGNGDDVKSFFKLSIMIADGNILEKKVRIKEERAVDLELASGYTEACLLYEDVDKYIQMVADGEEDFMILGSADGYLQFYGVDDAFVGETHIDLPDGDFRTYAIINKEKEQMTQRVELRTPYGVFTPQEQEVVSLDVIRMVVRKYYENDDFETYIRQIPCMDITQETKQYMGLK